MKAFAKCVLALFLAFVGVACSDEKAFDIGQIDTTQPFALTFFEGGKTQIQVSENAIYSDLKKPVIYTFFTSWCEACKVEAQLLSVLNDEFKEKVAIIGVLMEDLAEKDIKAYKKDFGVNYKISIGTPNIILDAALGGIVGTPYTIIADKNGAVVLARDGLISLEFLQNLLKKMLENQI